MMRFPKVTHWLAAAVSVASALPADAQFFDLRSLLGSSGNAGAPLPAEGGHGWSGESGASGHPLMQASAIRAAAAGFRACLAELWPLAAKRGVPRATFDAVVSDLAPDLSIMDLLDSQPEFTRSIWDYLDLLVSDERIANGRAMLERHGAILERVERHYGVDRHILTAIWGVESNYGVKLGDRSVLRSTATLACIGRRQDFFRREFLAALEIIVRGDLRIEQLRGSWAGAFGPTQFMPTTFLRYAVDFDGDGRRNIIDSVADAAASTANHLRRDGWVTGQTWGYEVTVPPGFDYLLADQRHLLPIRDWEKAGIRRPGDKAFPRANDRAFLMLPAGAQGPGFLMLQNYRAIMKYNASEAYALAIGHLADRLRGGGSFVQPWPRHERMLTRAERLELQQHLARIGYDVGEPDGNLGPRTRTALRRFQAAIGAVPDGFASASVLDRLRAR